jgi:methionyl-tRNA formyltransferase
LAVRVVLVTQVPPAAHAFDEMLRRLGHELVGIVASRAGAGRYGNRFDELVAGAPEGVDVVVPAGRERIAPLLRALEPDVLLCAAFPWKIPADALAVPRLGAVNGHPSLLPRHRGPMPMAWAARNGETEIGFTFHRMDVDFDTGPILAQARFELEDEHSWPELSPKMETASSELLPDVFERLERGDPGDPQDEATATYAPFFDDVYAEIDWSRPAVEIARQVRAWRFASFRPGPRGALTDLDGERLRVLRVSLQPGAGREVECGDGSLWVLETESA